MALISWNTVDERGQKDEKVTFVVRSKPWWAPQTSFWLVTMDISCTSRPLASRAVCGDEDLIFLIRVIMQSRNSEASVRQPLSQPLDFPFHVNENMAMTRGLAQATRCDRLPFSWTSAGMVGKSRTAWTSVGRFISEKLFNVAHNEDSALKGSHHHLRQHTFEGCSHTSNLQIFV